MLRDIKILKKNPNFPDITSLNTFIKNTKMCQKYMAITDLKKIRKRYVANFKIWKNNTYFHMTYLNTFIKKINKNRKHLCRKISKY